MPEPVYTYSSSRKEASFWKEAPFHFLVVLIKKDTSEDETDYFACSLLPRLT